MSNDSTTPILVPPAASDETAGFSLGALGTGIPVSISILQAAARPPQDESRIQTGNLPSG